MENKKLKWGILGTGRICNKLVPAIQKAPSSLAYSIASREVKKAEKAAKKFEIVKVARSYQELIEDENIDVIYIPLPNALHGEWILKAAKAKKHILCEKPLGINKEEVTTALQCVKENQVKMMEGYMWPHHPRTQELKKIILSGRLGPLQHITTALDFLLTDEYSKTRRTPELGGGALYDIGCYCIGGILWALDEMPKSLFATAQFENEIDTSMTGVLRFSSHKTATFHSSFNNTYRGFFEVVGKDAVLKIPQMWNPSTHSNAEIWEKGELKEVLKFEPADQIACMVENFNRHILYDEKLPVELVTSERILKVIDALYESAWTEERVTL